MPQSHILVVESDDKVRALLERFLTGKGYAVTAVAEGEDGVRAFHEVRPTLCLVAVVLEGLTGFEVARLLRQSAPEARLVLMGTERQARTFADGARETLGVHHYLTKPFGAQALLDCIEIALDTDPLPAFSATAGRSMVAEIEPVPDLDDDWAPPDAVDAALLASMESPDDAASDARGTAPLPPLPGLAPLPSAAPPAPAAGASDEQGHGLLLAPPTESFDGLGGDAEASVPEGAADADDDDDHDNDRGDARPPRVPMRRADTQMLLRSSELFPERPASDPLPPVAASPTPEPWGIETLQIDRLQHRGAEGEEQETRYALKPMVPESPNDPCGIYGEVTLAELLYNCFRDIFSGRLLLRRGPVRKQVYLVNGHPVNAESNIRSENLGYQLLLEGIITERQLRESVERAHTEGIRQGQAFIDMGVFDQAGLDEHLSRQVRERLLNCFGWTGAEYGLTYDPAVSQRVDAFEVSPLVIIFEGIKTSFPVAPLVTHFDDYSRRPVDTTPKLHDYATMLKAFADELRVASLCDGQRTVGEVLAESPYGLVDTLRILRAMEITSCVSFGPPRAAAATTAGARTSGRRDTLGGRAAAEVRPTHRSTGPHAAVARPSGSHAAVGRPATGSFASGARPQSGSHAAVGRPATAAHAVERPASGAPATAARPTTGNFSQRPRTGTHSVPGRGAPPSDAARPARPRARSTSERGLDLGTLVQGLHRRLESDDHYKLLGLTPRASAAQIRAAYDALQERLKADEVATLGSPELVEQARQVAQHLAKAFETLSDAGRREQYDALHMAVPTATGTGPDIIQAEHNFNRGRQCLDGGDAGKALEFLELACTQDPHQALYRMYRGWARFSAADANDRKVRTEAHDEVKQALLDDGTQDEGFVLLANIYAQSGNAEMAAKFYRKALGINRRNAQAARALRQIEGGPKEKEAGAGLFSKLFKGR